MPAPPGTAPAPSRRHHVNGTKDTAVSAALISRYVAVAKAEPTLADVPASKLGRTVRAFIAAGLHERELLDYVVSYSDPTAETAIRNVMRTRGRSR